MAELVYGKNTVIELIKAEHEILELYVTDNLLKREEVLEKLLKDKKINYHIVDKKKLDQMTDGNHQGIIAKIAPFKYYDISDMLNDAHKLGEQPFLLILDGLEDPHNLGAILRTAECCGVHGVIIPKNRSVSLNATVAKLSVGAIKYVKVAQVTNLNQTIKELQKNGLWVYACDMDGVIDYRKMDAKVPLAIVVGGEGKGISRLVKENSDLVIRLPMRGKISSLNASVAASIVLYEVLNQRCPL
ncbi:MAG: 23S rRNA (guanosine(2251)-2'-O)-methyltransferase RlmB [Bacilli bacterium]|nr:23S rRNA (guanosine(2251)-2'-O)-methyltransferase RlmB [Bacilli bacterium]